LLRANGIRFPPTIAAFRVGAAIGTSGVRESGRVGRYSEYAVLSIT